MVVDGRGRSDSECDFCNLCVNVLQSLVYFKQAQTKIFASYQCMRCRIPASIHISVYYISDSHHIHCIAVKTTTTRRTNTKQTNNNKNKTKTNGE